MTDSDREREAIVSTFVAELDSVRAAAGSAWCSLAVALAPIIDGLETDAAIANVDLRTSLSWTDALKDVDISVAGDLSRALVKFSEALTVHYRASTPRDQRVSQALASLYLDIQRPLWAVHPGLRPFALEE